MKAVQIKDQSGLQEISELLKVNKLPYQDLSLHNSLLVGYYNESEKLIGSGGLEFYSNYSLLRSIAVEEKERGQSLGKQIVDDLMKRAEERSITRLFLLTETAHDFFIKRGFKDISRDLVPDEVKASSEFASVCPVSAACMVYELA